MFEKYKAKFLFHHMLKRPDITKAYKMVGPEDSWYDTITTVHNSLAEIQTLPHENWVITSHDGLKLQGIFYPNGSDKTMIWVHGFTSHAERESAFPALFYRTLGFNVLIPYLRAHGPSEGDYITFGALEYRDMMAWVDKVNEAHPNGSILLHGLSMGGGIVLDLATEEMKNVKCLISDAPSWSMEEFFLGVSGSVFKRTGRKVAEQAMLWFKDKFGEDPRDFNRIENIHKGKYPVLLSAGSNEKLDGQLANIKQNNPMPTEIVILPGCNHGNGMYKQRELYQGAIKAFLDEHMK